MTKETIQIVCENCDSEYKLTFDPNMLSGSPDMCCCCGNPIDLESEEQDTEDDYDDEDENDDKW